MSFAKKVEVFLWQIALYPEHVYSYINMPCFHASSLAAVIASGNDSIESSHTIST